MVGHCLEAAEILAKEGISVEVINLRSTRYGLFVFTCPDALSFASCYELDCIYREYI